jgi:hypothetical protein
MISWQFHAILMQFPVSFVIPASLVSNESVRSLVIQDVLLYACVLLQTKRIVVQKYNLYYFLLPSRGDCSISCLPHGI